MAFERISLNIIPEGEMPVFHASQFDAGRPIIIDLYNGDDAYTPAAGVTFELHCRKVDDNIVTLDTYEVDGNTITFASTEQLCACSGDNLCEVAIILDDLLMGTLNFILHVERDPIAGGLTSETSIYNLTQQIDDIISGEGYVKDTDLNILQSDWNETDEESPAYIKNKPGPSTYEQADWAENDPSAQSYIKHKPDLKAVATSGSYNDLTDKPTIPAAQVNSDWNASSGVAEILNKPTIPTKTSELTNDSGFVESTDLADVATSGNYNDLFNKPTIPAAQVQSDWNQTNTSAVDYIKNKPDLTLVKSTSGNPCNFTTDLTDNLISVKANIAYNANGYMGGNVIRCGANIWNEEWEEGGIIWSTGAEYPNSTSRRTDYIRCYPNTTFYSKTPTGIGFGVVYYDESKNFISSETDKENSTFTIPIGAYYCRYVWTDVSDESAKNTICVNYPATDTAYHAYNGQTYTIAFGQTVYGGYLDVTNGQLVSTLNADGTEKATPDVYTLTPTAIPALSGVNNITSDLGGNLEVRYTSGELAGQIIDICKMVIAEMGE